MPSWKMQKEGDSSGFREISPHYSALTGATDYIHYAEIDIMVILPGPE
jgi:hypothetical protein